MYEWRISTIGTYFVCIDAQTHYSLPYSRSSFRALTIPLPISVQRLLFLPPHSHRRHPFHRRHGDSALPQPNPRLLSFDAEDLTLSSRRSVNLQIADSAFGNAARFDSSCASKMILGVDGGKSTHIIANSFSWNRIDASADAAAAARADVATLAYATDANAAASGPKSRFCLGDCGEEEAGFHIPSTVTSASASRITSSRILSLVDQPLSLRSKDGALSVAGNEGVGFRSGAFLRLMTERRNADIAIRVDRRKKSKFVGGELKLKAKKVFVVKARIPLANLTSASLFTHSNSSFKICVCPNGRLFRVNVVGPSRRTLGCFHLSEENNPCLSS